ncbi:MAG TPA: hypothetical protein VMX12_01370 [Acidimicrobiia bacterium]|nr:hypothetical protein [Acidimicrobiia bacterium]
MSAAATRTSGSGGKAVVDSTDFAIRRWETNETADYEETTDSASTTDDDGVVYVEEEPVKRRCDVTVEGQWDPDAKPTDDPPNFNPGQQVDLTLHVGESEDTWLFPTFNVKTFRINNVVGGKVDFTMTGTTSGSYTRP